LQAGHYLGRCFDCEIIGETAVAQHFSEELWGQYDEGDARDLDTLLAKGKVALSEATKLTPGRYLLTVSQQTVEITVADGHLSFVEVPYGDVSGFHLSCTDVDWATFLGSKSEEVQVKFLSTAVVNGTKPLVACSCSYQPYQGAVHPCPFASKESAADRYPVLRTILHADTGLPQSGLDARVDGEAWSVDKLPAAAATLDGCIEHTLANIVRECTSRTEFEARVQELTGRDIIDVMLKNLGPKFKFRPQPRFRGT